MKLLNRDVLKFGVLVGLTGILVDAVVTHGLFWENDPYWTYWITKTFLISTVFILGTRLLGIGLKQGMLITLIFTVILEVYYDVLSPIGLPQEPHWLPFEDLWTIGFIAHYVTILAGYYIALWLWYRRINFKTELPEEANNTIVRALIITLVLVALDVLIVHMLVIGEFPGITYAIQRVLLSFVFLTAWLSFFGIARTRDKVSAAVLLVLVWVGYSMYLQPVDAPGNTLRFLNYEELWRQMFPVSLVIIFATLRLLPTRFSGGGQTLKAFSIGLIAAAMLLAPANVLADASGLEASAASEGEAHAVVGPNPYDINSTVKTRGTIRLSVVDEGNRWSHMQNKDKMDIEAEFEHQGSRYKVISKRPMVRHPHGLYTTWFGVVYDANMHGGTGIGTNKLPKVKANIATWGFGEVYKDGQLISRMSPVHVMVTNHGPLKGIMLEVDAEDKNLLGAPDGYLSVMWHDIKQIDTPEDKIDQREWFGWLGLALLTGGFGYLSATERPKALAPANKKKR